MQLKGDKIYLPGIGWMGFYNSRSIPEGFTLKSVTVRRKARGWFVSLQIEDKTVPSVPVKDKSEIDPLKVKGCDLGINKLVSMSNGKTIANPAKGKTFRRRERRLKLRQKAASRKKKGSKNRGKSYKAVASLHERIASNRSSYHWDIANQLLEGTDALIFEDLNIKAMKYRCKPRPNEKGGYDGNGQSAKRG
ncbi:MAG: transposase, partial [Moorea sp. SIO3I7]|nr:transposase [Moorena sp. SIO3I7]